MVVSDCFQVYSYMMLAWIIMSWIPNLRYTRVGAILGALVEPYFRIFRRFIPTAGGIDFSPIVAFIVFRIIENLVFSQVLPLILYGV